MLPQEELSQMQVISGVVRQSEPMEFDLDSRIQHTPEEGRWADGESVANTLDTGDREDSIPESVSMSIWTCKGRSEEKMPA
jgi:hypothetical protein